MSTCFIIDFKEKTYLDYRKNIYKSKKKKKK